MRRVLSLVTVGLCLAAPAGAQPLGAASVEDYWLSVGGGGGVIVTPGGEFVEAAPTVLARVNVSSRLAVELALDFWRFSSLYGGYHLQAHYAPGPLGRKVTPFVTVGTLGYFESRRVRERRQTFATGDVVIHPAYRRWEVSVPFADSLGGGAGVRIRLMPRVAIETGGQFIFGGDWSALEFHGTVVVPTGPRKTRR